MNAVSQIALRREAQSKIVTRPRLGFLGLGSMGRAGLQALVDANVADIVAVSDVDAARVKTVAQSRDALGCASLDQLLRQQLDGVVIATPSASQADHAMAALERGVAVFCQKPLARNLVEATQVVATARAHNRLLGIDFGYRHVAGMAALREQVRAGDLGEVYAIDLTFHNAYGPDKAWFYDVAQSGGGCVMDLGAHLIDLAMWVTGCKRAGALDAQLYQHGKRLSPPIASAEDYASVQYQLDTGACVRLACSWRLPAGTDARIEAAFYGTRGGASLRNVDGSFCDFTVDRHDGARRQPLAASPDAWGGRALVVWTRKLARGGRFDLEAARLVDVAAIVDRIYGR